MRFAVLAFALAGCSLFNPSSGNAAEIEAHAMVRAALAAHLDHISWIPAELPVGVAIEPAGFSKFELPPSELMLKLYPPHRLPRDTPFSLVIRSLRLEPGRERVDIDLHYMMSGEGWRYHMLETEDGWSVIRRYRKWVS